MRTTSRAVSVSYRCRTITSAQPNAYAKANLIQFLLLGSGKGSSNFVLWVVWAATSPDDRRHLHAWTKAGGYWVRGAVLDRRSSEDFSVAAASLRRNIGGIVYERQRAA